MDLIPALLSRARIFEGEGVNHEGERFVGRLRIEPLVNETALMLHYTATRLDGVHLHAEATLLASDPSSTLCLWPVMEELPVVLPHPQASRTLRDDGTLVVVFASGPREIEAAFREEIGLELAPGGELIIAHAWGLPNGPFEARSRCVLLPARA